MLKMLLRTSGSLKLAVAVLLLIQYVTVARCTQVQDTVISEDDSETAGAESMIRLEPRHLLSGSADHCVLHKALLHQGPFPQYVMYKSHIPDLKEFTLCSWHKFYNHSTDHPIFSYSARGGKAGEIRSWISNNYHSSYYQMAVNGYTIYRLNYPTRLHKWYHACQSWNGRTGEWQIWVNSERVGRGFYNLLTGMVVKGGGSAVTGQDTKSYGQGFMGEVTLLMLYKAALTAGKAYYTHKHHHVHKFHHEDKLGEDDPENTDGGTRVNLSPDVLQGSIPSLHLGPGGAPGEGPRKEGLLIGMQLEPRLPVDNLSINKPGLSLLNAADILGSFSNVRLVKRDHSNGTAVRTTARKERSDESGTSTNVEGFDSKKISSDNDDGQARKRRGTDDLEGADMVRVERMVKHKEPKKRTTSSNSLGLLPGFDLASFYGGKGEILGSFPQTNFFNNLKTSGSPTTHSDDNYVEPAEWEVKSVMSLCSACGEDPFRKANVLSWVESPKKLAAGALFVEANQQCHQF